MSAALSLDHLVTTAQDLARAGGTAALAERARWQLGPQNAVTSKSSPTDPVTAADAESERVIVGLLEHARPGDGVLGEESASVQGSTGLRWVIDPIDGTVNFLYRRPDWGVSVAVEKQNAGGEWTPIVGAVFQPETETMWAGRLGETPWAERNGVPIHVSSEERLSHALIATGFAYRAELRAEQGQIVAQILGSVRDIRRCGSAALDLCAVATGTVDGYYEVDTKRWDVAAGTVIVQGAGGVITPMKGGSGGVLAANHAITTALAPLVNAGS